MGVEPITLHLGHIAHNEYFTLQTKLSYMGDSPNAIIYVCDLHRTNTHFSYGNEQTITFDYTLLYPTNKLNIKTII